MDFVELDLLEIYVIFGMDWLDECYSSIDYKNKVVRFQFPNEPTL